jgi:DNA (cytosine-5)-methyltransferase 1
MEDEFIPLKQGWLFLYGGWMSYECCEAGTNVLAGIDYEPNCKTNLRKTIHIGAQFIQADVWIERRRLETILNLERNDNDLILIIKLC